MENIVKRYSEIKKLKNDDAYYFHGENNYQSGWKMHLFLNDGPDNFPDLHDNRISKLSKFLIDKNLEHKFKNGCDGENTFCIYIGDRSECEELSEELTKRFSKYFQELNPKRNNKEGSDFNLANNIGIRFDGANEKLKDSPFLRYGSKGIPTLLRNQRLYKGINGDDISKEKEEVLKKLTTHMILAKFCGEKYLGKNYEQEPWDRELFNELTGIDKNKIDKYISTIIAAFKPQNFIKSSSLVTEGRGIELDVSKILGNNEKNKQISAMVSEISKKWDR